MGINKEPNVGWKISPSKIPGYNPILHGATFAVDPFTGQTSPSIVVGVACSNESIPKLTDEDLNQYFGPGTGTRIWISLKVFEKTAPHLPYRWWYGMATCN